MVDRRTEDYRWTDGLNAAYQLQYQAKSEGNGAGPVALIRKLTGWPWHICRPRRSSRDDCFTLPFVGSHEFGRSQHFTFDGFIE